MTEPERAAVELCARVDTLYTPHRWENGSEALQAVLEARHEYSEAGLRLNHGGDTTQRKANERAMRQAEAAGLVSVTRPGGRAVAQRLTDKGDQVARALVGLPGCKQCLAEMLWLLHFANRGDFVPTNEGARYVREQDLAGFTPEAYASEAWKEKALDLEDRLLPGIVRGWVVFCFYGGRVAYAITPTGEQALATFKPLALPRASREASKLYADTFCEAWRASKTGRRRNEDGFWFDPYFWQYDTQNEIERQQKETTPAAP